ncbi:maltooligosyl trehalose hydrolase [Arboricoccus pini]|uniref:Malto-oligosyltrehalose trehalohydrolase n=1 Tax=Arboricoccus pini TaxID=1963835 RepID=A0A212S043_9PROT|nr:malto-oligosyltrehalose trehalohydrolase [Arboricoccus pini]SNB78354.1 maltooligosyl trehalose hydrolase [Arboricoccus pini]
MNAFSGPRDAWQPSMPFGAQPQPDGSVRFGLWAPDIDDVALAIGDERLPMRREANGWFTLVRLNTAPGTAYRFALPNGMLVPDPASQAQLGGPEGPSLVVDQTRYRWHQTDWRGRPFEEAVILELHAGAFAAPGGFQAVAERLDGLAELGITAIELMPIADFVGARGWGYDGVLPYAPASIYGSPDALKALVDAAHARGIMVFLDVVYNHFGPAGNFLPAYAGSFFTKDKPTPWGAAIDFSRPEVRAFFRDNAIYWLEVFRLDGLRFDAVHAILDDSNEHFLTEVGRTIRARFPDRHIHLILENERNEAQRLLGDPSGDALYDAQWADDIHNASHVLMTKETDGYYEDYEDDPAAKLARGLTQGFVFQGDHSRHKKARRGQPSAHLSPRNFVFFLQNHDQIGNRAMGDRLTASVEPRILEVMTALLLLSPTIPMLFMGEEWGAEEPFPFFCDFKGELADAVRKGRAREFARFKSWAGDALPDALARETFERAILKHPEAPNGRTRLVGHLLGLRQRHVVPFLKAMPRYQEQGGTARVDGCLLDLAWQDGQGRKLRIVAHLSDDRAPVLAHPLKSSFYESQPEMAAALQAGIRGWSLAAAIEEAS